MSAEKSDGEKFCQGEPSEVKKLIRAWMKYRKEIFVKYRHLDHYLECDEIYIECRTWGIYRM